MSLARVDKGQPNTETLPSARCPTTGSREGGHRLGQPALGSREQWLAGETRGWDRRGRGGSPSTCGKAAHSETHGPAPLGLPTPSSRMPAAAAVSAASVSADARRASSECVPPWTDGSSLDTASFPASMSAAKQRSALSWDGRISRGAGRGPESHAGTKKGKRWELGIKARGPRGEP